MLFQGACFRGPQGEECMGRVLRLQRTRPEHGGWEPPQAPKHVVRHGMQWARYVSKTLLLSKSHDDNAMIFLIRQRIC